MPAPTAQNLVLHFRSAARLAFIRSFATSTSTSTANISSSSSKKNPSFSSSSSATGKKVSTSSIKKKRSSSSSTSSSSTNANAQKKPSSGSALSPDDDSLKKYVSSLHFSSSTPNVSQTVKNLLKTFKAPSTWAVEAPPESSLGDIVSERLNFGGGNADAEAAKDLATHASSILYDEMDLHWDESEDEEEVGTFLEFPWLAELSNNSISMRRKEYSRERKQKWVYKSTQTGRFDRLLQMCAQRLGADTTIGVFGKLGKETGVKEFNSIIKFCIEQARETTDEDVALEQVYKSYQILKTMRERGFKIEEGSYGQFLLFLIDYGMVEEFFFFGELIKEENPDSLPRLGYYEMLLWITVNNEAKIRELCDSSIADAPQQNSEFREQLLIALSESDHREEFLMLLRTLDATKFTSFATLECTFRALGKFCLESVTENFLQSLKGSGIGNENISNFICECAISTSNLAVEDIIEKFQKLHNKLDVLPTSAQYEKLIKHCCELLKVHEALGILDKALDSGVALSLETFHFILDACDQSFEFHLVYHVNSRISSSHNLKPNNETFRRMVLLCVKMKDYEGAYRLIDDFQKMGLTPSVNMFNAILAGYLREKNISHARNVLKQMEDADVKPDAMTYSYLIQNCKNEKEIIKLYDEMINMGIEPTKNVFMALINAYAACGLFQQAKEVILDKRISSKDLIKIKSVLIGALASKGHIAEALEMYEKETEGPTSYLDPKAIRCLIGHLQSVGEFSKLLQLLDELKSSPFWVDACFDVISRCIQDENLSSTVDILKKLNDKLSEEVPLELLFDEVFFLYAEKEATNVQFGLNLLQAMKEEFEFCPSRKILDFLLSACANAKDSEASFVIWKEYKKAGLPYNVLSYLRMYHSLLASGDRKSAGQILKNIQKVDPHVRCIVKACQITYITRPSVKKKERQQKRALAATLGLLDALKAKTE